MKKSTWIPLLAAGVALAGAAVGAYQVLKKRTIAAQPQDDTIEIPLDDDEEATVPEEESKACEEPCEEPCCAEETAEKPAE